MAEISYRLHVLQKLTEHLKGITPANGYAYDLSSAVYRGKALFSGAEALPMVSILESPRPDHTLLAGEEGKMRSEKWHLLLQGWVADDILNPTDPAYDLVAAVEKRLGELKLFKTNNSGLPADPAIYMLGPGANGRGTLITCLEFGPPVVRPPTEQVSSKAFFYLPVYVGLAVDSTQPYITL